MSLAHGVSQYQVFHAWFCNDPLINLVGASSYSCGTNQLNVVRGGNLIYNVSMAGFDSGGNQLIFAFYGWSSYFATCSGGGTQYLDISLDSLSSIPVAGSYSGNHVVMVQYGLTWNAACTMLSSQSLTIYSFDKDGTFIASNLVNFVGLGVLDSLRIVVDPANGVRGEFWLNGVDTTNTAYVALGAPIQYIEQVDFHTEHSGGVGNEAFTFNFVASGAYNMEIFTNAPVQTASGGIWGDFIAGASYIGGVITSPVKGVFNFLNTASGGFIGGIWVVLADGAGGFLSASELAITRFGLSGIMKWIWLIVVGEPDAFINYLWGTPLNPLSNIFSLGGSVAVFAGGYLVAWIQGAITVFAIYSAFFQGGWILVVGLFKYAQGPNGRSMFLLIVLVDFAWAFEIGKSRGFGGLWEWIEFHVDLMIWPFKIVWWFLDLAMWTMNIVKTLMPLIG